MSSPPKCDSSGTFSNLDLKPELRKILQFIMLEKMVSPEHLSTLISKLFVGENKPSVIDVIGEINAKINVLDQEVSLTSCQYSGDSYYVFIMNCVPEAYESLFPVESEETIELDFLCRLIKAIVEAGGLIGSSAATNLFNQVEHKSKPYGVAKIREILEKFITEKKIKEFQPGKYGLTATTLVDQAVKKMLATYVHVKCSFCEEPVLYPVTCDNCGNSAHIFCVNSLGKGVTHVRCASCRKPGFRTSIKK